MKTKKQPLPYNGIKIKKRLVELNMTQRELAKAIGMNENYLTDVLNGRRSGKKYMDSIMETLGLKEKEYESLRGVI
jgi:transcriptional regulator with XRE-family HTH domain